MVSSPDARRESDARAMLAAQAAQAPLPGDYLIVGPHASFAYHRWLMPVYKIINLRIRPIDLSSWQAEFTSPWTVLNRIPTTAQLRSAVRVVLLEPGLTDALYNRRRVIGGLNFISPEDCCLELVACASTQISLSEIAALLVAQRATLDWDYLVEQAAAADLAARLEEIVEAVNREAGRSLLPLDRVINHPKPDRRLVARRLKQLTMYLPPALVTTARPPIAPATIADVLRGLRASGQVSDGR